MNEIVGKNIKAFRKKLEITQEALAEYLGVSRVEVNYYENGTRNIPSNVITKAAQLFAVDEYDLYEEEQTFVNVNVALAFRAESLNNEDLKSIANFKKVAMNYLKMKNALRDE